MNGNPISEFPSSEDWRSGRQFLSLRRATATERHPCLQFVKLAVGIHCVRGAPGVEPSKIVFRACRTCLQICASENVGAIVVAENDEPVGIITDRDVALAVTEDDNIGTESVRSVMTEDPVTLHEGEEAIEISRTIDEHNVRRIPVVDDAGTLTGIVTVDDLVATIGEQLDNVADTIEVQSPEYSP